MKAEDLTIPVVRDLVTAINAGDRQSFLSQLTPDASLSDDGRDRVLTDWIDREIFTVNGKMTIDHEERGGLRLQAHFRNDTWGDMSTFWQFELAGDKISRIETGQARLPACPARRPTMIVGQSTRYDVHSDP